MDATIGAGTRLCGDLVDGHVVLEPPEVIAAPSATHLRCRIVR